MGMERPNCILDTTQAIPWYFTNSSKHFLVVILKLTKWKYCITLHNLAMKQHPENQQLWWSPKRILYIKQANATIKRKFTIGWE